MCEPLAETLHQPNLKNRFLMYYTPAPLNYIAHPYYY